MDRTEMKSCPECGMAASDRQQFCRRCGFEFPPESLAEERALRAAIPEKGMGSCITSALRIAFLLFLVGIVIAIIPTRRTPRGPSREKACYANMRVLLGALEMYNMDSPVMQKTMNDQVIKRLTDENYLKGELGRPEAGCRYTSTGDMTGKGRIRCDVHGTVESEDQDR